MGAFKCNALAPCHRHFPWSGCLMARLSGFFTAFNISVSPSFKNNQFRFFSERFYTSADSFISKNEGMAEVAIGTRNDLTITGNASNVASQDMLSGNFTTTYGGTTPLSGTMQNTGGFQAAAYIN